MHNQLHKLDFTSIQSNDLLIRINRMLGNTNTKIRISSKEITIIFKGETENSISRLNVPKKIGQIPISCLFRSARK